jgi:GH15 family glucan-1,4-alpha-glucosidase
VVLKGLTYRPTGGIVAAPTTSLPEWPGGVRNWDYRYCWLRDAAWTFRALVDAGYLAEADEWRSWLVRVTLGDQDPPQIMYGVEGQREVPEWQVEWLPGFQASRPVRVGNAAAEQVQIDVYGEVMDAMYEARRRRLASSPPAWDLATRVLGLLESRWRDADEGIWEVRGGRRHFTHSKVMAWVAFDRGIKMCEEFHLAGPTERWRAIRDEIKTQVCSHGWNDEVGSFTQSYGSKRADATLLLLGLVGFLSPDDDRIRHTLAYVQRELSWNGFLLRYRIDDTVDGLPAGEGVFLPCSFWLVEALARDGRHAEATSLMERLLDARNDLGLLAEEYDPTAGRLLGNFPQALSHIALINAAVTLADTGAHERRA